jgi:hypothetical protein
MHRHAGLAHPTAKASPQIFVRHTRHVGFVAPSVHTQAELRGRPYGLEKELALQLSSAIDDGPRIGAEGHVSVAKLRLCIADVDGAELALSEVYIAHSDAVERPEVDPGLHAEYQPVASV